MHHVHRAHPGRKLDLHVSACGEFSGKQPVPDRRHNGGACHQHHRLPLRGRQRQGHAVEVQREAVRHEPRLADLVPKLLAPQLDQRLPCPTTQANGVRSRCTDGSCLHFRPALQDPDLQTRDVREAAGQREPPRAAPGDDHAQRPGARRARRLPGAFGARSPRCSRLGPSGPELPSTRTPRSKCHSWSTTVPRSGASSEMRRPQHNS
mmetsp:Transcript_110649/g.263796  ORF Transcript_110649/g.263796 Transcript_110649/m.263796 type:complete len:207 (+) Transcript_110649:2062-2682(+)